jgi:hypothetical protein
MRGLRTLKRLLAGLAVSALTLAAMPAQAQSTTATRTLPVTGNAPQVCALQRGTIQPGGLVNINGTTGDTLRITQLTDSQTLAARAASATISFAGFCNFPHRVRIESSNNGLWPTDGRVSAASGGFAYAVPYDAQLVWGVANGDLNADATVRQLSTRSFDVNQATAGDLTLRIVIAQGASNVEVNAPVLAGAYSDTLRIFLEPR